jgi:hypothetical protein
MRRTSAAVSALLTASATALALTSVTAAAATVQTPQADAALRYLYGQIGSHGDVAGSAGATADVVISAADNGFDPATMRNGSGASSFTYLRAQEASITTAGAAAKYVLAWVAAGRPADLNAGPLLTRLNTRTNRGGFLTAAGTFHNANASIETANAYSQALAVLADVAAHHTLPARATAWLTCAQRPDGGFGYVINDSPPTPRPFCGDTASDTNDSGIILQALGQAGTASATQTAEAYLHSAQQHDGGFGFSVGGPSDPGSDTVVIQALVAIGQDPSTWTVAGANPITDLETFADPAGSGGYVFPGHSAPDAFTTSAVPQALALKPYAAPATFTAGLSPGTAPTPASTPLPGGAAAITVPATGAASQSGPQLALGLCLLLIGGAGIAGAAARRRSSLL